MTRRIPPSRERRAGGVHGAVDIRFAGDLDFVGDKGVVGWVVDGEGLAGGGGGVGAVDEEVGLEGGRHGRWDGIEGSMQFMAFALFQFARVDVFLVMSIKKELLVNCCYRSMDKEWHMCTVSGRV